MQEIRTPFHPSDVLDIQCQALLAPLKSGDKSGERAKVEKEERQPACGEAGDR